MPLIYCPVARKVIFYHPVHYFWKCIDLRMVSAGKPFAQSHQHFPEKRRKYWGSVLLNRGWEKVKYEDLLTESTGSVHCCVRALGWQEMHIFANLSATVEIESYSLSARGRCVMKSISIDPQCFSGIWSGLGAPKGFVRLSFCCWHIKQPAKYNLTSLVLFFQWYFDSRCKVFRNPKEALKFYFRVPSP